MPEASTPKLGLNPGIIKAKHAKTPKSSTKELHLVRILNMRISFNLT